MQLTKQDLFGAQKQISALLGGDKAKTDRFMATAYQAGQNGNIAKCNGRSVLNAVIQVAQLGLSIDPQIGHAYMVPYKDNATLQIGYRGWVALLKRYGYDVKTHVVYYVDKFHFEINGWDDSFSFSPDFVSREDDSFEWVYGQMAGVITMIRDSKTGDVFTDFTPKRLIEKLRLSSSNQTKSNQYTSERNKQRISKNLPVDIWETWYAEMAMAKAIKRHAKKMPLEETIAKMLEEDDLQDIGEVKTVEDDEQKQDLNALITAVPNHNKETGEVIEDDGEREEENVKPKRDERVELTKALMNMKVMRSDALKIVKELSDDEVSQYLSDPASIEALVAI